MVVPAWKQYTAIPSLAGDLVISLDPGRSFGTGAHPSTALVLGLLQSLDLHGLSVLDVGCGSGILSVAAARLGAATVTAIDVEEAAVPTTLANATRNGVAVSVSTTSVAALKGSWDVVLANILAPILIELASDLTRLVARGGRIVLSGLIDAQRDRVLAAYPGFEVVEQRIDGVWIGLLTHRRAAE